MRQEDTSEDYATLMLDAKGQLVGWSKYAKEIIDEIEIQGGVEEFILGSYSKDKNDKLFAKLLDRVKEQGFQQNKDWVLCENDSLRTYKNMMITSIYDQDGGIHSYSMFFHNLPKNKSLYQESFPIILNEIADAVPHGFLIVDEQGKIYIANREIEKLSGYSIHELLGMPVARLIPEVDTQVTFPINTNHCNYSRKKQEAFCLKKQSKQVIPLEISISPIFIGNEQYTVINIEDITERQRSERINSTVEKNFQLLVQSVKDYAILTLNPEGLVTTWNTGAERIKGYSAKEIIGKPSSIFYSIEDVKKGIPDKLLKQAARNGSVFYEGWRVHKSGRQFWAGVDITSIYDNKSRELIGFTKITQDLTKQKKAEELNKKALKEKEILLEEVYHRVKNNLQVVVSLLHMQVCTVEDDKAKQVILDSECRIKSMALVHEQLYRGKNLSQINLPRYIETLVDQMSYTYLGFVNHKHINVKTNIEELSLNLETAIPLGLIINELLANTYKHAFHGREKGLINIQILNHDKKYELIVSDDGIGLPKNIDFYNLNSLGAKLIQSLSSQLGGKVRINSRTVGTKFSVTFPK